MAKIPSLNSSQGVSLNVPRANSRFQGAGQEGRALANLGKEIGAAGQKVGGALADLEQRRKKAEVTNFGDTNAFEYRRRVNKFALENKMQTQGTDHKGYTEALNEFMQNTKEELSQGTEDVESQKYFNAKITPYMEQQFLVSQGYEAGERAKFYTGNRLKKVDQMAAEFFDNPDPFLAARELREDDVELLSQEGNMFSPDTVKQINVIKREKMRDSIVSGQIRDGLSGIVNDSMTLEEKEAAVDNFISGKVVGTEALFEGMGPKEKKLYSSRLRSHVKNAEKRKANELKQVVGNAISLYAKEDSTLDPQVQGEINTVKLKLQAMPDSTDKTRLTRALDNAETVFEFKKNNHQLDSKTLLTLDEDDLLDVAGLETADLDATGRKAIRGAIQSTIIERNKDGKEYINKHFKDISRNVEASMEQQKALGISDPRVFSKTEASTLAAAVLEETNPTDRALAIDDIISQNGAKYGYQALSEMADENKNFHKGYVYSAFLPNRQSRENVITALSKRADNKDLMKTRFTATDITQIENDLNEALQDEISSFHRADLGESANQFTEMVEAVVMQKALQRGSVKGVVEESVKEVIHDNFNIIDNEKALLIVPKSSEANAKKVEDFVNNSFYKDTRTGVGREIQGGDEPNIEFFKKLGMDSNFYATGMDEKEFYSRVAEQAFWAMDKDTNGMKLMLRNDRTGITGALKDSSGAPIVIKYDQIGSFEDI